MLNEIKKEVGESTGRVLDVFIAKQMELDLTNLPEKAIFIKLSPGTELFNQVVMVSQHLEVKPARAGRILMKAGLLGYNKSKIIEMRRKQK